MASVGALHSLRSFRRGLPWALGRAIRTLWQHIQMTKPQKSTKSDKHMAKRSISKLAAIASISTTLFIQYGCTTQAWYEGVKMNAQNSCANQPPAAYQECRSRINNQQYDQYEKERAAAKGQ
jgi:hypothetical protein